MTMTATMTRAEDAIIKIADSRTLANAARENMHQAAAAAWAKDYDQASSLAAAGKEQAWSALCLAAKAKALAEGDEVQTARAQAAWNRASILWKGLWSFRIV